MVDNSNYQEVLFNKLINKEPFQIGEEIQFRIKNRILCYRTSGRFLTGYNCTNDYIFELLGVDPYEFCSRIYEYLPSNGIFPETRNPIALVSCVYALFQACDSINEQTDIKEVVLSSVKSSLLDNFIDELSKTHNDNFYDFLF